MSAASLAFHGFLAFFPALVAAIGVLGLGGVSPSSLRRVVGDARVLLPVQMANVIDEALRRPAHGRADVLEIVFGLLVAVWSSIEAMAALQLALDAAYEVDEDRGFVRRRIAAVPLVGVTVLLGGVASLLLVLGNPIRRLLPASVPFARPAFDALWLVVRWAGAIVLIMLLLSALYALAPRLSRRRWEWRSPGSIVAALGWLVSSGLFSVYLDHFGHESRSYGAFAGVAVMLLWLFLSSVAILFGAELNRELERVLDELRATSSRAGPTLA